MEDDKIKDLFQGFQPELSPETLFMARLQHNMEAVEIVKQHNARVYHNSRIAVAVAAVSGFIVGVILTLLYPIISSWISSITVSLPSIGIPTFSLDSPLVCWLLIGGACVTVAINAYELTLSRLSFKQSTVS